MSININEICRLCMCSENTLQPLFGPSENLLDRIHKISSVIEISAGDGLPSQVCQRCVLQVDVCYNFKLQCEMSDAALRCYLSNQQAKDTTVCLKPKCVDPKEEGPAEKAMMKGHKFGDVTAITPHCVENLALEWGWTNKDLPRNTRDVHPDVITECICETAEPNDAVTEPEKWHDAGFQAAAAVFVKEESNDTRVYQSQSEMLADNVTGLHNHAAGLGHNYTKPIHTEKNTTAAMKPDTQVPSSSSTNNFPVGETPVISSDKGICQRMCQWGQAGSALQSSDSSQYNYGDTHIALSYWDKQFGQSGNNITAAALHQWIMSSSDNNGNNKTPESPTVKKPVGRPKQSSENVKYHQCPLCGKSVQRLSLHMRMHTGDRPYQCSQCGQRFTQLGSLKKHQTLHSEEKPFHCNVCGKCFRCKSDLSLHSKLHTGKSFDCPYCSKSFVTQKAIDNHVRIHTGEKPYLCHVCGMSFSQEGNLSMHVKVHTGEKPFQCSVCSKYFATRTHLEKHTRTHTGEKPYTCATCQKSFSDRGYFMRHLAVHTGEKSHVCTVCNKAFTQRISLKRHSRIHTGEKPFECVVCREAFSLKRDLKRHCEKVHNIDRTIIPMKHQLAHFQHFTGDLNEHSISHHQY